MNNAWLGWGLAVVAVAAGYVSYGWRGATGRPLGQVPNAVMLNARLQPGMRLPDVIKHTRSLGRKLSDQPETWAWADEAGDEVHVVLINGRISAWELKRAGT